MPRSRSAPSALQDALQRLGAKRVEATLVAALAEKGPLGTKDLVEQTGLRQPEVSVGMQALRDRDWVDAEAMPRTGKGRPMHRYRLKADPAAVRKHYEAQGQKAIQAYEEAMQVLKRRLA